MIDLHAHVLPGVDDGPETWTEAMEIVAMAADDGIRHIVSTSHMWPEGPYANKRAELLRLTAELQERVRAASLPVTIHPGAEVYLSPDTARGLEGGQVLTYGDAGRYVLIELPAAEVPRWAEQVLFDIQLRGITPIIAHPERNREIMRQPERLAAWVERGILAQITASSLYVKPFAKTAKYLIRHGMAHFIATDTHGVKRRPPVLSRCRQKLEELVGAEGARRLLLENPKHVIEGKPLPVRPFDGMPSPGKDEPVGFLRRLFRRKNKP